MLKGFFVREVCTFLDGFGCPATLKSHLKKRPNLKIALTRPIKTIYWDDVSWWDCLKHGIFQAADSYIEPSHDKRLSTLKSYLDNLTCKMVIARFSLDIRQVEGLSASKSNLSEFSNLDEFSVKGCSEFMESMSKAKLLENLEWREVKISNSSEQGTDSFVAKAWDGRFFLSNGGGSHHFAAARFIAGRIDEKVPLQSRLRLEVLSAESATSLFENYYLFALGGGVVEQMDFVDIVKPFLPDFFLVELPSCFGVNLKMLTIPKRAKNAATVAQVFSDLGFDNVSTFLKRELQAQNGFCSAHNLELIADVKIH